MAQEVNDNGDGCVEALVARCKIVADEVSLLAAVAASRGMSVDLTQHGKELVLGFKHGRRVSVYHVNGVRFLFKVKGGRAKG